MGKCLVVCQALLLLSTKVGLHAVTSGLTWRSSLCVSGPNRSVMGYLPIGCILVPLTTRGITCEGSKLCSCSPSWLRIALPAAEISAPQSGSVSTSAAPFSDEMWTLIVGACPVASPSFA